jgi:DNA invertase Pin-like site-specific DNA recombinase
MKKLVIGLLHFYFIYFLTQMKRHLSLQGEKYNQHQAEAQGKKKKEKPRDQEREVTQE